MLCPRLTSKAGGHRSTRASDLKKPALEVQQQRKGKKRNSHTDSRHSHGVDAVCAVKLSPTSTIDELDTTLLIQDNEYPVNRLLNN